MTLLFAIAILPLLVLLSLVAYIDRLYFEMGKLLSREYQENIDVWTRVVEPRLHMGRDSIALSATVLTQLVQIALAMLFTAHLILRDGLLLNGGLHLPTLTETCENIFALVLLVMIFGRLLPHLYFMRTRGFWTARISLFIMALFYLVLPVTLLLGLMISIAALAEPRVEPAAENSAEAVDALLEAGEEEGILEESDRELMRSAVEFGDKVAHEVMTPRPEVFAVSGSMTLAEFTEQLSEHAFSRVPVYSESLDQITGIAFAHDLLQVADADAAERLVSGIQRPAEFVPETKKVNVLLREMQREKQHMRIVIDEYGAVAGLVTIEDLLEEIVGNIADEHDVQGPDDLPVAEADGAYVVGGTFEVARLSELFGESDLALPEEYDATTLGGLVTEMAGRIPLPGEVIETDTLRFEVLASTDRRIDRLRLRHIKAPAEDAASRPQSAPRLAS
jgi:CBS domain containing-hemolysin-like protein